MEMDRVTCKTPAPTGRKEAWAAWESAHLSQFDRKFPVRAHMKVWEKEFRGGSRWWLYAVDVRPNRMEVKVRRLSDGEEIWIKIGKRYEAYRPFEQYIPVNGSAEMIQRQAELHRLKTVIRLSWLLAGIPPVDVREEPCANGWFTHAVYHNGVRVARGSNPDALVSDALRNRHYVASTDHSDD